MSTFVTHPSVRIKGTENNYSPVTCTDMACMHRQSIHWHCPFCSCTESFNDVVILKAHYRVKHVDKGIEFAGLKVLRCCDTCDIVGAIKGEKKFKGAHWHCYRCRNGFNRRDEAIKHYRTHFRNPQTTFQIQIAQEVNHPNAYNAVEAQISANNIDCDDSGIPDTLDISSAHFSTIERVPERVAPPPPTQPTSITEIQASVAANETVNSTPQAIMLIQGGNLRSNSLAPTNTTFTTSEQYSALRDGENEKSWESKCTDLQIKYQEALEDKARLTMTVEELKLEMQMQMQEVARYQKREEELLNQLSIPLDKSIQDLLKQLENEHRELLYHQLAHIKRSYPGNSDIVKSSGDAINEGKKDEDVDDAVDDSDDDEMSVKSSNEKTKDAVTAGGTSHDNANNEAKFDMMSNSDDGEVGSDDDAEDQFFGDVRAMESDEDKIDDKVNDDNCSTECIKLNRDDDNIIDATNIDKIDDFQDVENVNPFIGETQPCEKTNLLSPSASCNNNESTDHASVLKQLEELSDDINEINDIAEVDTESIELRHGAKRRKLF